MSSSKFDAQILAAQHAKNALLKKVGIYSFAAIAGVSALYLGVSFVTDTSLSSEGANHTSANTQATAITPPVSEDIMQVAREELQQMLVFAENAVADIEQDTGRNNFNANAITPLRNTLQLALGSYSSENYQQAGKQLEQLKTAVMQFEQDYAKAWQAPWEAAQTAFSQVQHETQDTNALTDAQLHTQRVLHLNPGFGPAKALQARLDVWQEVQQYQEKLRVAQVENNLSKQLSISQKILLLDPDNQEMAQRITKLQDTLKQQRFNDAIVLAREALGHGDTMATIAALKQARSIDSNRAEVTQIQQELDVIATNNSIARFEKQIATMQTADNWSAAQRLSATAKAKHPDQEKFELSLQLANQILDFQSQLSQYLARPERLADVNIHNNARQLLAQVSPVEIASKGLKSSADALRSALQDSLQTMAVTVLSDGRTDIRVLGKGVVGKTREKVIQLLPGNYRFEGRRKGYQSKIVAFTVKATDQPQSITLVCDQKI